MHPIRESFDDFDQIDVFLEITKKIICQNKISALLSFAMNRMREGERRRGGKGREGERVEDKPWEIGWTATSRSSSFTIALAARCSYYGLLGAAESFHVDGSEILLVRDDPRLQPGRTKAPDHGRVKLLEKLRKRSRLRFPIAINKADKPASLFANVLLLLSLPLRLCPLFFIVSMSRWTIASGNFDPTPDHFQFAVHLFTRYLQMLSPREEVQRNVFSISVKLAVDYDVRAKLRFRYLAKIKTENNNGETMERVLIVKLWFKVILRFWVILYFFLYS